MRDVGLRFNAHNSFVYTFRVQKQFQNNKSNWRRRHNSLIFHARNSKFTSERQTNELWRSLQFPAEHSCHCVCVRRLSIYLATCILFSILLKTMKSEKLQTKTINWRQLPGVNKCIKFHSDKYPDYELQITDKGKRANREKKKTDAASNAIHKLNEDKESERDLKCICSWRVWTKYG